MALHDVVQKNFATIVKGARFHVLQNQIHVFSPLSPQPTILALTS
jgi:hypothetical protein